MDALWVEQFAVGEAPAGAFAALRARLYPSPAPEPLPGRGRCFLAGRGEEPVAHLSVMAAPELAGLPQPCFTLGHFEALDAGAGGALLRAVQDRLRAEGAVALLGPMNGSTWAPYRLALPPAEDELTGIPPFPLEPWNPPGYAPMFQAAGFRLVSTYESRIVAAGPTLRPGARRLAARIAAGGVVVRPLAPHGLADELRRLYDLSAAAFAPARYYRPIDFATFRALYGAPGAVDPRHLLLAEDAAGRLLGFLFAYPDRGDASAGTPARLVVKTLACAPEAQARGLGAYLADLIHARAWEQGYRHVIHALMHNTNPSVALSARFGGRIFRRYALYAWSPERAA